MGHVTAVVVGFALGFIVAEVAHRYFNVWSDAN